MAFCLEEFMELKKKVHKLNTELLVHIIWIAFSLCASFESIFNPTYIKFYIWFFSALARLTFFLFCLKERHEIWTLRENTFFFTESDGIIFRPVWLGNMNTVFLYLIVNLLDFFFWAVGSSKL